MNATKETEAIRQDNPPRHITAIPLHENPSRAETKCTGECSRGGKCPNRSEDMEAAK